MATLSYAEPAIYMPGGFKEPDIAKYPITGGTTFNRGAFLTIASGLLTKPAGAVGTGIPTTGIVGLSNIDSTALYFAGIGGSAAEATPAAANTQLFGYTTATTALQPGLDFQGCPTTLAHNGQQYEVSLAQAFAQNQIGVAGNVGVALDAASGYYIADTSATNKVATIVGEVDGPGKGTIGDFGKRVIIVFLPTVLAF